MKIVYEKEHKMKVLAFGASYSLQSINRRFASYAAHQFKDDRVEVLDLTFCNVPVFTVDLEAKIGHPDIIMEFIKKLGEADLIIISLAEHNGSYSAAFKNLFDWASRIKMELFENKKMLLLSTSTGIRGGANVLAAALSRFPRHGADIIGSFSLPNFDQNFSEKEGIMDASLNKKFQEVISKVKMKCQNKNKDDDL